MTALRNTILPKETNKIVNALLIVMAQKNVSENLVWNRTWSKEEFEERNYKEKILKIQKDKNITLDQAIEDYIVDYYQEEYEEEDFDKYDELCLFTIDEFFEYAEKLYKNFGDKYKVATKENLDKIINKKIKKIQKNEEDKYTTFDLLYEKLTFDILTYNDNYEGLKKLILA